MTQPLESMEDSNELFTCILTELKVIIALIFFFFQLHITSNALTMQ